MRAYVGVGTNLGDRWRHLRLAARALASTGRTPVVRASRVYETEAVGREGPRYLNAVLELETAVAPRALLELLLAIEGTAHRRRGLRWAARTLDLDLLAQGGWVVHEPGLVLPHPRLASRRFVLAPLADLVPGMRLPGIAVAVPDMAVPDMAVPVAATAVPDTGGSLRRSAVPDVEVEGLLGSAVPDTEMSVALAREDQRAVMASTHGSVQPATARLAGRVPATAPNIQGAARVADLLRRAPPSEVRVVGLYPR